MNTHRPTLEPMRRLAGNGSRDSSETFATAALKGLRLLRSGGWRRVFAGAWTRFWVQFAGMTPPGRVAARLAVLFAPPYKARGALAAWNPKGFVAPGVTIHHVGLRMGAHVFLDERVLIFQDAGGGPIEIGGRTRLWRDVILQTGQGGSITIGSNTHVQPRCVFSAYKGSIRIGSGVQIAPHCGFYPYDHGMEAGEPIIAQPLQTKGDIVLEDDVWLGFGVTVLAGVRIGSGAVIGAGSVVTRDVPAGAIAAGVPARVIRKRDESAALKAARVTGSSG